ncbi:MAG: hypothetical protein ACFFBM_12455 [Promethearchaeota archaeon]
MTDPLDQRIDVNSNASGIVVSARYDFDGAVYNGSLALNNSLFSYPSAQRQGYKVSFASGDDSFGITTIRQNAETYCIWDSLIISITDPPDQRVNIGDNATGILVGATYAYEGSKYDGTFVLNDTQFTYATVGKRGYEVLTANGDDGYGITAISTPDSTFCIWDRLRIEITVDGASLFNGQQANFTLMVTYDYDSTTCTTYEIVISRNTTAWHLFTDSNKSLFRDTAFDGIYYYNASSVSSETDFGIIAFITTTQKVTWSEAPNEVPVNTTDGLSMLENADDSDNLYARYRFYVITSNVSDGNGYDALQYVEISLYDNLRTQSEWTLRYTIATDSFSIQQGAANVALASWSSASGAGNQLVVTWIIKIDWDHSDLTDIDIRQHATDGIDSDEDYYEVNWDVETRLDISGLTISDGSGTVNRGPLDGSFGVSGTLLYLGSGNDHPLSNETDVWVLSSGYGSSAGPWSDTTLVLGQFALTAFADDAVGEDTITVIAVEEGSGSGAQDLFSTSIEGTYAADRVLVQSYSPDDSRVNVDDNVDLDIALIYEFDSSPVTDGTVTVNSIPMSHVGGGVWRITVNKSSVQEVIYNSVTYSGGTHGLNQVDQNGQFQGIIWDSLTISITSPIDSRINIFENALGIGATATYDFDNSDYDGTLNLNDTSFVSPVALKKGYTVLNAAGDDTYGITLISLNDVVYCIWDSLTIAITDPFDQRVNIGTNASGIVVTAVYDYDNLTFDGILSLNVTQFLYNSPQRQGYGVQGISGGVHGITAVANDAETYCIWDALRISILDPTDQRIDVNQNASGIVVSARYDYDNTVYDGSLILNDTDFIATVVMKKGYTVLSAAGDDFYGITAIISNDITWCIWDQVMVFSLSASDARDNVDDPIWVDVILRYEYDNTPVEDGSVTVSGYVFDNLGMGLWRHNRTETSVIGIIFNSVSCTGNNHGIQSVNQNSQSQTVIWDQLLVTIAVDDRRIDVGSTASIQPSAIYAYDSTVYDGTLQLNDTIHMHADVGRWAYTVVSASGDSYDISLIASNDEDYVIWDRLEILSYWTDEADNRTNVGATRQVYVTAHYEYDGSIFQGAFGTLFMNGSAMTWHPTQLRWNHSFVYLIPVRYTFQVSGVSDSLYGLTVVGEKNAPRFIIWDKLNVIIEADSSVAYYDELVNFTVTATYQYDNSRVMILTVETLRNGTESKYGNFSDTWNGPIDARYQYLVVSAQDSLYGISEFDTIMIEVFWTNAPVVEVDAAFVSDGDGLVNRVNIGTLVYIYFHCVWRENSSPVETGLLYVDSTPHDINETGWVTFTNSSSTVLYRQWPVTDIAVAGAAYYQMDISAPYIIWDAVNITLNVIDERINVYESALTVLDYDYVYAFDGSPFNGNLIFNQSLVQNTVGRYGFTVMSVVDFDNGINTILSNDEVSIIWDGLIVDLSVSYHRVGLGTPIVVGTSVIYAFDGEPFDGNLQLNDTVFLQSFIGIRGYTVREDSINGGTYGINAVISNDQTYVIWDELEIYDSGAQPERSDLGSSSQVRFWIHYIFDQSPYTNSNGRLWINGTQASYNSTGGYWFVFVSHNDVGEFNYFVERFEDDTSTIASLRNQGGIFCTAKFDSVYVSSAGVRGRNIAEDLIVEVDAPDTLSVLLGSEVIIYFQLRYASDGALITDPNTLVIVNGKPAAYNSTTERWEVAFTSDRDEPVEYRISSFRDRFGLTEVDHRELAPIVAWTSPPISPYILLLGLTGITGLAIVFVARARRRVTTLEHALTPEELLSLEDVGISSTMRAQIVNHLEWLRDLSEEIPYMGNNVLVILSEELTQARQMYVKAFELELPTEPAGLRLRDMLLDRIDTILESIEKEMASRSSRV